MLRGPLAEDGNITHGRDGIGHLEYGRHSTGGGGTCGVREILLLGQAGLARMDVWIDEARKDEPPGRVDLLIGGGRPTLPHSGDTPVLTDDVPWISPMGRHDQSISYYHSHRHPPALTLLSIEGATRRI